MPIPGSVLSNMLPFGLEGVADMYPSKATLRPMVKTGDTTGQDLHVFADSVNPDYVDLACRKSPLIQVRPQSQELMTGNIQRYIAKFQVNFSSFISVEESELAQWQVKVDGSVFQILGVESDGSRITTRLIVSDAIPYNP